MAGLMEEFGIDLSNVQEPEFDNNPPDDIYEWTLGDVSLKVGSKNHPEKSWIIFKYLLGEGGNSYSELFSLPENSESPTAQEITRLGFYKQRLTALGVLPEAMNTITADELIGSRGTFELRTTRGKDGKDYQNIRSFKTEDTPDPSAGDPNKEAPKAKARPATAVENPFA